MANDASLVLIIFFFVILIQELLDIDLTLQYLQLLFLLFLQQLLPLIHLLLVRIFLHAILSSLCLEHSSYFSL